MDTKNDPSDCSLCLICSSSVTTPEIKVEPYLDQDDDDGDKSIIVFLLATLLEIPQNELQPLQDKLINQQLKNCYCESCTKLIYSAKSIYTQILELTQNFRTVQKQMVQLLSTPAGVHPGGGGTTLPNHHGLLDFCRNFVNKRKVKT